jgi:hypothetical protein
VARGEEGALEIFVAVAYAGEPPEHLLGRASAVGALAVCPVLVRVVVGEPTRVRSHEFGPVLGSLEKGKEAFIHGSLLIRVLHRVVEFGAQRPRARMKGEKIFCLRADRYHTTTRR